MKTIFTAILLLSALAFYGQTKRDLLSSKYSEDFLKKVLRDPSEWYPEAGYPTRDRWNETAPGRRAEIIANGEKYLNYRWPAISASSFLAFDAIGDRDSMQLLYNSRKDALYSMVEAELLEAKGRFLYKIIDGVWSMCKL